MLATVERFFRLLEARETDRAAYEALLHPRVVQTEYPNLLTPRVRERDLEALLAGTVVGARMLATQRYEVVNVVTQGATLVVESRWTGTMAIDAGALRKGQELRAYVCFVFEFEDGRIVRQRNYDCYEPLERA